MVGWIILAVLAVLILLVFFVPYGVDVSYAEEALKLGVKAGPFRIWLLPKKPLSEKQSLKAEQKKAAAIPAFFRIRRERGERERIKSSSRTF